MSNRLASEPSSYLRQHADNPVDWWPWGDAAFEAARASRRPVLLSIGYASCHWCHVMAHECFDNAAIAEAMNAQFVNIKVDREDRPDLDRFYQLAHQALSGRGGGWPLTLFLDPNDRMPFLAGTYFPPVARHGLPAFGDVLQRVRAWYDSEADTRSAQSRQLAQWLQDQGRGDADAATDPAAVFAHAAERMRAAFDRQHGGHHGAPKFPHVSELEWLLDVRGDAASGGNPDVDAMLARTLDGMRQGGLQDHLAGGFFRYCVDDDWSIPHFEKMLYDNAQLLGVYARAASLCDRADWAETARAAAAWLRQEMQLADGGLAASLDADSPAGEGAAYVWTQAAFESALDEGLRGPAAMHYGLDAPANFEGRAWHLTARVERASVAERLGLAPDAVKAALESARIALLQARRTRPPPARDDKLLCGWNAMAISALARASRMLGDPAMLDMAERALAALRRQLWPGQELLHGSSSPVPGFLDDHALLLEALLDLLACRWRRTDLDDAVRLADTLLERFPDRQGGGLVYAASARELPVRVPPSLFDESLPSATGTAARVLLRLGHWLGDSRYLQAADRALESAGGVLARHPAACATLLRALRQREMPPAQVMLRCHPTGAARWREVLAAHPHVDAWLITDRHADLPGVLADRALPTGIDGRAWLCRGTHCEAPIDAPAPLHEALAALD